MTDNFSNCGFNVKYGEPRYCETCMGRIYPPPIECSCGKYAPKKEIDSSILDFVLDEFKNNENKNKKVLEDFNEHQRKALENFYRSDRAKTGVRCPICKEGELFYTGECFTSFPMKYGVKCEKCFFKGSIL